MAISNDACRLNQLVHEAANQLGIILKEKQKQLYLLFQVMTRLYHCQQVMASP